MSQVSFPSREGQLVPNGSLIGSAGDLEAYLRKAA
jgi:hypothetical protein